MLDYYKLTDSEGRTHGGMQWGPGVTHTATGTGAEFCSPDLIHFYDDPLLAVMLNPIHGDFSNPRLWRGNAGGEVISDNGLKFGAKVFTTLEETSLPPVSLEQRVKFAVLCGKQVYTEPTWVTWADNWLSGRDRSAAAAATAAVGAAEAAAAQKTGQLNLKALAQEAMA